MRTSVLPLVKGCSIKDVNSHDLLGEILLRHGWIDDASIHRALQLQQGRSERLGTLLVQLGFVAERDVVRALGEQLGMEVVRPEEYPATAVLVDDLSPDFLASAGVVPLADDGRRLVVAMVDPQDNYAISAVALATDRAVQPKIATAADIERALERLYGDAGAAENEGASASGAVLAAVPEHDVQRLRDLASDAPVVRCVDAMLRQALEALASDIHVEPLERGFTVRYRVDGMLRETRLPNEVTAAAIVSRVKVLANLDIAERRLPQDGRMRHRIDGRAIDMRVSTVPTMHGEGAVLRILDRTHVPLDFGQLGFGSVLAALTEVLERPHGVVLVTGPTGSGKTTTLYTALRRLYTPERKVVTVEDPVEYQLSGVNQIQIKPHIGLTFAAALRSILRQDPDVIMVGEMRDIETARIALQAALTGHKVLSTLHTNDAPSSITRLLDMGVEPYLITSTVNGVVAQRLVRVLCRYCREAYEFPGNVRADLPVYARAAMPMPAVFHRAVGCPACDGTGYHGRVAIVELLKMTDAVRGCVLRQGDSAEIRRHGAGLHDMFQDGLCKALAGVTTLEELARVAGES